MNVVITGGSRGIGAAAVRLFARRGDRVWFLYEKNDAAARAVAAETGALPIRCDVADEVRVTDALSAIPDVDVLINNAGIAHYALINQITPEQWHRIFAVHVDGAFYCIRAVLPSMLAKQRGCIINVSSMWGQVGASCEVAYSAAKGALLAMTKALAQELGPSGIRVNAVAPGVIQTDMCASVAEDVLEDLRQQTPIERLGTPEDVAQAMAYLADAAFVTGQVLPDKTTIVKEYSKAYGGILGEIPYYAIINPANRALYDRYRGLAEHFGNLHLLGRLAEYKYYNMDAIAARALELAETL